jgi:uncharacterized membrane protein
MEELNLDKPSLNIDRNLILKWAVIFIIFFAAQFLTSEWRRIIHITSSVSWWGMVFFLNFILLPVFSKMNPRTQHEVIGYVIPRVFRGASILGFFSVGMGWRNALEIANKDFSYFFSDLRPFLLLLGGILATGLYLFHLFLEKAEIEIAMRAANEDSLDLDDPEVKELMKKIQLIPMGGFLIMSLAALTMLLH